MALHFSCGRVRCSSGWSAVKSSQDLSLRGESKAHVLWLFKAERGGRRRGKKHLEDFHPHAPECREQYLTIRTLHTTASLLYPIRTS